MVDEIGRLLGGWLKSVITRLDRLARSITHLLEIVTGLERRCVGLRILSLDPPRSSRKLRSPPPLVPPAGRPLVEG